MNEYSLITLNASELLKDYQIGTDDAGNAYIYYYIDFRNPRERRRFIKNTNDYHDTALFFQLCKAIGNNDQKRGADALSKVLFFVDFDRLFENLNDDEEENDTATYSADDLQPYSRKISREYRLWSMFEHGIHIRYDEDTVIDYVPFDKSSSMARKSRISFIDATLLKKRNLNERLNLGLTFQGTNVNRSKFFAYRGLYLTDADRVAFERGRLNPSSLIVIEDFAPKLRKPLKVLTAKRKADDSKEWILSDDQIVEIGKAFDGEGLISFELADEINSKLGLNGASSFQIRMPFVKGMLHKVDFHTFLRDTLGDDIRTFIIKDAFGVERDLCKADVVIPDSMFKCMTWLKAEIKDDAKCMDYYFQKYDEYDHGFYVSNTDLSYGKSSYTKLNYQFLNTLELSPKEFVSFVEAQKYFASHPVEYLKKVAGQKKHLQNEEELDEAENNASEASDARQAALLRNPVFAYDKNIKNYLQGISDGLKMDLACGRFLTQGETRYLSRDLLSFLVHLLNLCSEKDPNKQRVAAKAKEISEALMPNQYFFMPNPKINLSSDQLYPILRSPHLSRNEQCALRPYLQNADYYYKYFSHLRGIVMVASKSLAPNALAGADFDGDIVKVFEDSIVRKAVLEGAYDKAEVMEKGKKHTQYSRKQGLDLIEIPTIVPKPRKITDFQVIKDTFSSRVGQISNLSIRLGAGEYGKNGKLSGNNPEYSCAKCTILTGLEIDAVKNGEHPDLTEIIDYGKDLTEGFDYISDFKEKIEEFWKNREHKYFPVKQLVRDDKSGEYRLYSSTYDIEQKNEPFIFYQYVEDSRNIDQLPKIYFDSWQDDSWKMTLPEGGEKINGSYLYFEFQRDEKWKAKLDKDLCRQIGAVEAAYFRLNRLAEMARKQRRKKGTSTFESHMKTILQIQYDDEDYQEMAGESMAKLWNFLDATLCSVELADDALKRLKASNWPFLLDDQKINALTDILQTDVDEDAVSLLTNFDGDGYKLLYYAMKDVRTLRELDQTDEELVARIDEKKQEKDAFNTIDREYYYHFYQDLYQEYLGWSSYRDSSWKKKAFAICKSEIEALLSEVPEDQKIEYIYFLSTGKHPDYRREFFWSYFSPETILKYCATADKAAKDAG